MNGGLWARMGEPCRDDLTIRAAEAADAADVGLMLNALDTHYLGPDRAPTAAAAAAMAERAIAQGEGTRFALADLDGRPVGLACYALLRPGHRLGGVLWLKDLFVRDEARGRGVGRAILAFLAGEARAHGIARIDLTTEPDNAGARRLYESLGARAIEKVFLRIEGDALGRMKAGGP